MPFNFSTFTEKSSSQFRFYMTIGISFVLLILLIFVAGLGQVVAVPEAPRVPKVQAIAVALQQEYESQKRVTGRVESQQNTQLAFEKDGLLLSAEVDEGAWVEAGQMLAQLDQTRLQAQLTETKARLSRVMADARLAKLSEKRVAELVRKNLESNQRLDEVRESTKAAVALVAEVQASIQRIEVESEKSLLRAPYKGYISRRMIDPGTVIGAGQGVFNLIRMDGLQGRFALPLSDASDLALGKAYPLFYANQRIVAELKSVSNERRFDTRTLDAVMSLPEQGNWLPGDLLHLHLTEQHQEEGAWLPLTALYSGRRGLWTVYILTPQEDDLFKISTKLVKVLYQTPEQAYVKGPLTEDDLVVVSGGHRLVAQQLVSLDQTAQVVR